MYIIGNAVYGVDLSAEYRKDKFAAVREEIDRLSYIEDSGVTTTYHGGADSPPTWFGLKLGYFDECGTVDGETLRNMLEVNIGKQYEYEALLEKLEALSPQLFNALKDIEPKSMVVWASS